jgi:4-diphosphocytidyl-2-C-methyl-D-erythritol kinase
MVMQSVGLADTLSFRRDAEREGRSAPGHPAIDLQLGGFEVPAGSDNIIIRAAAAFSEAFQVTVGVGVRVEKHIPVAAGLAGGSADAAATLLALSRLYRPRLTVDDLIPVGVRVGADVAFCLVGGTCLVQGLGEIVTPLESHTGLWVTLCKPVFGVSTADAYRWFDALNPEDVSHPETGKLAETLRAGDPGLTGGLLSNVLEAATLAHHPELAQIKDEMRSCGFAGVVMSGSGPTLFGVADGQLPGRRLAELFADRAGVNVWPNLETVPAGVTLEEA